MSVTIGRVQIPDGSTTIVVVGPLQTAAQVTLTADNTVWMAATAGLDVRANPDEVAMLPPDTGVPIQLNLGAGDALYFGCPTGNGPVDVSYVIVS